MGTQAIAGTPLARSAKTDDGRAVSEFARTPPLPSYLVAFALTRGLKETRLVSSASSLRSLWNKF